MGGNLYRAVRSEFPLRVVVYVYGNVVTHGDIVVSRLDLERKSKRERKIRNTNLSFNYENRDKKAEDRVKKRQEVVEGDVEE